MGTIQTLSRQLSDLSVFGLRSNLILVNPRDLDEIRVSKQYRAHPRALARPEWEGRYVGVLAGRHVVETDQVDPGSPELVLEAGATSSVLHYLMQSRRVLADTRDLLNGTGLWGLGGLLSKIKAIWRGSDSWTEKKAQEEQPNR